MIPYCQALAGLPYHDRHRKLLNPGLPANRPRASPAKKSGGEGGEFLGEEHLAAIFVGKAFGEVRGEPCG
jgi:hypothetical protein